MALQANGKVLVVGRQEINGENNFALVRLSADGSLDAGFGSGGAVVTDFHPTEPADSDVANAVVLQPDGKIVVGGYTSVGNGSADFALARYEGDPPAAPAGVLMSAIAVAPWGATGNGTSGTAALDLIAMSLVLERLAKRGT